jgi:hypothetical protein
MVSYGWYLESLRRTRGTCLTDRLSRQVRTLFHTVGGDAARQCPPSHTALSFRTGHDHLTEPHTSRTMMTPAEFERAWGNDSMFPLVAYPEDVFDGRGISAANQRFLTEAGLPEAAAPALDFGRPRRRCPSAGTCRILSRSTRSSATRARAIRSSLRRPGPSCT